MRTSHPWEAYQQALLNELIYWAEQPQFSGRSLSTVFFGGGTPSLAPPELIVAVLDEAARHFPWMEGIEVTLEANPGTVDAAHFAGYRAAGVNRLSLGVQSLHDDELQWLERIHSRQQVLDAVGIARQAGFDNLNLDLMYGLPGQSMDRWFDTLDAAIALGSEHLSCYQLTVEPHTRLAARHGADPYALPDEDASLSFLLSTRHYLLQHGYEAYEISNFSLPGRQCRHNDAYWRYCDYLGVGAGAAGKWDLPDGGMHRYSNYRQPERYMQAIGSGAAINSEETLIKVHAAAESFWLGLRRSEGMDLHWFANRFGISPVQLFASPLNRWLDAGDLALSKTHLRVTESGLPVTDAIAEDVLAWVVDHHTDAESSQPHS